MRRKQTVWEIYHISRHIVSICLPFPSRLNTPSWGHCRAAAHCVSLSDEITSFCELLSYVLQANLQPLHVLQTLSPPWARSERTMEFSHTRHRLSNCSLPQIIKSFYSVMPHKRLSWQTSNTQTEPDYSVQNLQMTLRGWLKASEPQESPVFSDTPYGIIFLISACRFPGTHWFYQTIPIKIKHWRLTVRCLYLGSFLTNQNKKIF